MIVLLILSLVLIGGTIFYGVTNISNNTFNPKKFKKVLKINIGILTPIVIGFIVLAIPGLVNATEVATTVATTATDATGGIASGLKYVGAALSTGLAAIGAGVAVAAAVSSSIGAVSEDEKLMGKTLLYVGLSEGIALYGMLISFMILLMG